MEADLIGELVRSALKVAKVRGKKLDTHYPRVKGKGAKAVIAGKQQRSSALLSFIKPLLIGAERMMQDRNDKQKAKDINKAVFQLSVAQSHAKRLRYMKLLK